MRITLLSILILMLFLSCPGMAEDVTTVEAKSEEIGQNLDLNAIASAFGESKDLEEFEKKLNDPDTQLSNLDLNEDGEVDYLRVMETVKGDTHLIAIQAVMGKDEFQDVATIEVEKDDKGNPQVQVVGDVAMYGPNYICEPVYVHPPIIFTIFWAPYYHPWYSPWYWGYYPPYYRPWRPYPPHIYRKNVNVNINIKNEYKYTSIRKSKTAINLHDKSRKNTFEQKFPEKTVQGAKKDAVKNAKPEAKTSTGKKVQENWKPSSPAEGGTKGKAVTPNLPELGKDIEKPDGINLPDKPDGVSLPDKPEGIDLPQKPSGLDKPVSKPKTVPKAKPKSMPKAKPKSMPRRG